MLKFQLKKLVRDKIVDHQTASGAKPSYRSLGTEEHKEELIKKIIEEAHEILHAPPQDIAAEIADVQQALDDLRELYGISSSEVAQAQSIKNKKDGPFTKGFYVDFIEIDEDDKWVAYYRKNADRYPEIT